MNAMKSLGMVAFAQSLAAMGCASQSAEFRGMSAVEHESAARAAQGDPATAAEHIEAANRLRYDEQVACDGVSDVERASGPFARQGGVTDVEVVRDRGVFPKAPPVPVGVAVYLRAEPGLTQQWLGRVIECHRAHIALTGRSDQRSPLSVPDAVVAVSTTYDGFRVTVTSKNQDVAHIIVDKGQELAASTYSTRNRAPRSVWPRSSN
jgi:hypothetical protein